MQLKHDLSRLARKYEFRADAIGFSYAPEKAVEEFKYRHRIYCPSFVTRVRGELRVFWVGANQSQDECGFLQALHRVCNTTVFHNMHGKYGLWDGNNGFCESPSFAEIRKANDDALLYQIGLAQAHGGIDVLIGQMWAHLVSKEALAKVQEMGIPVICIAMDDRLPTHWGYRSEVRLGSIGLGPNLDMALTTASETCLWYGLEGCPSLFWPLGSDAELFAPTHVERDIKVLFIGNRYGVRGTIIDYLAMHGIEVTCYGAGWPNGSVNSKQLAALHKRALIILGVGTVGHCSDVFTLKLRDFDAAMTGALYLTHRNPDLCNLFREGEEIECYETPKEARNKIYYYLNHEIEREQIGQQGRLKALAKFTWDERLICTFRQLGLLY